SATLPPTEIQTWLSDFSNLVNAEIITNQYKNRQCGFMNLREARLFAPMNIGMRCKQTAHFTERISLHCDPH
ncbi:hypothetical protein L4D09_28515, partial [Photobacterium makurazakiensis]|uniref:hypothetical protein n=1 Tax=Photobacterium makurazakiensis TaxID=2910234 RepID=UPI003D109436